VPSKAALFDRQGSLNLFHGHLHVGAGFGVLASGQLRLNLDQKLLGGPQLGVRSTLILASGWRFGRLSMQPFGSGSAGPRIGLGTFDASPVSALLDCRDSLVNRVHGAGPVPFIIVVGGFQQLFGRLEGRNFIELDCLVGCLSRNQRYLRENWRSSGETNQGAQQSRPLEPGAQI
jgi:hypothetical protein